MAKRQARSRAQRQRQRQRKVDSPSAKTPPLLAAGGIPGPGGAVAPSKPAAAPGVTVGPAPARAAAAAEQQDPAAIEYLRNAYRDGKLVLFVGAGVSQSAGLQGWWGLLSSLMNDHLQRLKQRAADADADAAALDKYTRASDDEFARAAGFEQSAPILGRMMKDAYGPELIPSIQRLFLGKLLPARRVRNNELPAAATLVAAIQSELMSALVEMLKPRRSVQGVESVVTYNYDNLLEERLTANGIECVPVLSERQKVKGTDLPVYHVHGWIPLTREAMEAREPEFLIDRVALLPSPYRETFLALYDRKYDAARVAADLNMRIEEVIDQATAALDLLEKLADHPDVVAKRYGNFVFSEDEYHREYADAFRWSNLTQISLMTRHTCLLIGLSLTDANQRRLLDLTHRAAPAVRRFAILSRQFVKDKNGQPLPNLSDVYVDMETQTLRSIGITPLWVDDHNDVPGVIRELISLDRRDAP